MLWSFEDCIKYVNPNSNCGFSVMRRSISMKKFQWIYPSKSLLFRSKYSIGSIYSSRYYSIKGVKKTPVLYRWFDSFFCIWVYRVYYIRIESIQWEENIFILLLVHISSQSIKMIETEVTGLISKTVQAIDRVIDTSFGTSKSTKKNNHSSFGCFS